MYECEDCGNTEVFRYRIEGHEKIHLDPETGEPDRFEMLEMWPMEDPQCDECGSVAVDREVSG